MTIIKKIENKYGVLTESISAFFARKTIAFLSLVLYKAFFDILYCTRIANHRTGFYYSLNIVNAVAGWLALLLLASVIHVFYEQDTASATIMTVLTAIYFVPLLVICGFGGGTSSFLIWCILYWILLVVLQIKTPVYLLDIKMPSDTKWMKIVWGIMLLFVSVITFYFWIKYSHFHLQTDLYNVYELRAQASTYNVPTILLYLRQGAVIVTAILIVKALTIRKYYLVIYLLFIIWISFSYAADKSVALFPLLLIGGYIFYRKKMSSIIIPGFTMLQVVAYITDRFGIQWLTSFIFARQGTTLAQLSFYTYKFFQSHPNDLFRQGIMGKLGFHSIYGFLPNTIGNNFVEQTINCNNGMLSDVWSSFGAIGVLVMPVILIACFRFLDMATYGLDNRQTIGIVLFFSACFANAQWSTVLLTQGYMITALALLLFSPTKHEGLN